MSLGVSEMEAGSVISVDTTIWASSVVEALAVGTFLSAANYFSRLLSVIGSLLDEGNWSLRMSTTEERFPFDELHETKQEALKNEDAIETDEDDEEEDDDANDDDDAYDDDDDEDFSAEEEGEEGDPEDNLQANGEGGSEEDDNEEEDDDDDEGEDEEDDEEDEDEDEEDVPQPPSKKRK